MAYSTSILLIFLLCTYEATSLIPPKFQWKTLDFAWKQEERVAAMCSGKYVPENNMPTGLARWKDKLFITIPRWKDGIPSSLNYVYLNGTQEEPLHPYPNWEEACLTDDNEVSSNRTVVSTFRVHVDSLDRLWVVDNGVTDMATEVKQITEPALLVFDLKTDKLIKKHIFPVELLRDTSVLTSIVVETRGNSCSCLSSYAYITDMGSNAIIVYDMQKDESWRVENHYFHFDPHAGVYTVGGVDFYWSDGISSAALSPPQKNGNRDLYFQPTSSTKLFKMSTELLRDRDTPKEDIFNGVEVVGDRGPNSQVTACDIDPKSKVIFYTQVCKNGLGCWNLDKPFVEENVPVIFRDCNSMEFPNDVKVDDEGNVWILSNRQAKFLYDSLDYNDVNYRVLTASAMELIQGSNCMAGKKEKKCCR